MFALDGFDEEQAYGDPADVTDMGDIAFPQSDDEDSSTNGKLEEMMLLWSYMYIEHSCVPIKTKVLSSVEID